MNANPYAPPVAELDCTESPRAAFFVVGTSKFALMIVSTFGLYVTYWLYKNWKLYRAATGNKVIPIARELLGVFFMYSLFTSIDRRLRASGRDYRWYPRLLAISVIMAAAASMGLMWLPDVHISFALSLLILLLQVCSFLRVQEAINYLENDVAGTANSTLTFANGVWFTFGLCCWGVAILVFYALL
ncbi:hypothetical protein OH720_00665 [Pseudomonas sp. WJP1]|uniref:hypothetical protein n=1 Tax=Pseudomonas sp. WJP1 TaxID=2986947 RepID=UPI00234A6D47|nr:hypothetical protein [Pseudomonas sp. WJP1]WCM51559.1 hypothetical protein OH720_00665 [Pseudomonas sp. WJP1]